MIIIAIHGTLPYMGIRATVSGVLTRERDNERRIIHGSEGEVPHAVEHTILHSAVSIQCNRWCCETTHSPT